jgi:uncharacterized protein
MNGDSILNRFPQLFGGLFALSIAIVIGSFMGAGAIREVKRANDVLTVTGSARKPIRSDYIIWRTSVSSQQLTLPAAYQQAKRSTARVQRYLKEKNVPDNAITISSIETSAIPEILPNGQDSGKTRAYQVTQRLEIRSNEVDRITALSRQANDLINEGIAVQSRPPEYLYTQIGKLRVEMLAEATKDAKQRAEAIASSTGNRIGPIRSAKTGVFQITPRYSTEVSDSGVYDTSSLEKDITAVVSVSFGVE